MFSVKKPLNLALKSPVLSSSAIRKRILEVGIIKREVKNKVKLNSILDVWLAGSRLFKI